MSPPTAAMREDVPVAASGDHAAGAGRPLARPVGAWLRRRRIAVVYVTVTLVAAAAAQTWFSAGRFIAAGDVGPFIRDGAAAEFGWLWSHQTTGAGSASTEITRSFEVAVSLLVRTLGGSDLLAQRVLYAVIVGGAALGVAWFAGALTRRAHIVALAGLLGFSNPLLLIASFNPVLIAPIGVLAGLCGCVVRAARGRAVRPGLVGGLSASLGYLALNPPTLAVTVVTVVGLASVAGPLVRPGGTRRAWRLLLRAAPWALALNLWWMVPMATALVASQGQLTAVTDIGTWSWSHANNTLWDVAALNAHWTWTHDEYLPAAAALDRPWWVWLRYLLPAVALSAPLVATGGTRRRAALIAAGALGLIVIGKGVHPPFGGLNTWLYDTVPGFWLLREPLNKIGPPLLLCYVALAAVWLTHAPRRLRRSGLRGATARGMAVAVVAAAIAYPWPVWTGAVAPVERAGLPGTRVSVPDGWRATATAVNSRPGSGKVLVLPLHAYYQVETTWGYHGIDSLPSRLFRRPVLLPLPGGYFGSGPEVTDLLVATERALARGEPDDVPRLLQALGVSHLVVRRDLVDRDDGVVGASPERLARTARSTATLRALTRSDVADVFEVDGRHDGTVTAYSAVAVTGDDVSAGTILPALPSTMALGGPGAAGGAATALAYDAGAATTTLTTSGAGTWLVESTGTTWWRVRRRARSVELQPVDRVRIDDTTVVIRRPIELSTGRRGIAVTADDQVLEDGALVRLRDGASVRGLATAEVVRPTPTGPVGDCNTADDRTPAQAGIGGGVRSGVVRLRAAAHSACIVTPLDVPPAAPFELELEARGTAGAAPRVCVWQVGPDSCAPVETTVDGAAWTPVRTVVTPATGTRALKLYVYADGTDDGTVTRTAYRNIVVRTFRPTSDAEVRPPSAASVHLGAGQHQVAVTRPASPNLLSPLSAPAACGGGASAGGVSGRMLDDGVVMTTRGGAACAVATITAARHADDHVLSLDYRTPSGRAARLCVWHTATERCAVAPDLTPSQSWRHVEAPVDIEIGQGPIELYLYADSYDDTPTTIEYRNVRFAAGAPARTSIRPATHGAPPTLLADRRDPAHHVVEVADADTTFVIGLAETFDAGWRLRGLPSRWTADHVEVDGYANGWVLRPVGRHPPPRLRLELVHVPSERLRPLLWLAVAVAVGSVVHVCVRALSGRVKGSAPGRSYRRQVGCARRSATRVR